eukprot:TRINITY_DN67063_c0_g1_i1.p1 TRINITY_DN67063_c0_g1~~TRINITY_DN67063_c0_g1_i1.p1  ORF type:complete len:378 (-),score=4.60 TRINITY_DN67063_c0_g1_i1:204-1220(-)
MAYWEDKDSDQPLETEVGLTSDIESATGSGNEADYGYLHRVHVNTTKYTYTGDTEELKQCKRKLIDHYPASFWGHHVASAFPVKVARNVRVDFKGCWGPYLVNLYYAVGRVSEKMPLVSYAHGRSNGGWKLHRAEMKRLFQPLASQGFFVVAYQHGGTSHYCGRSYHQLAQIRWLSKSKYASLIDFDRVAVLGHSMGGKATLRAAARAPRISSYKIKVAATINAHCLVGDCPEPRIPTLMFTGNHDLVSVAHLQHKVFDRIVDVPAIFAQIEISHGFNAELSHDFLVPAIDVWFRCHLYDDHGSCHKFDVLNKQRDTCIGAYQWNSFCQQRRYCGPSP